MALFIISFLLCVLALSGFFYHFVNFKKDRKLLNLNKTIKTEFSSCVALFAVACVLCGYGIVLMNKLSIDGGHHVLLILGSIIFGASFMILVETFTIYYYKPELIANERKLVRKLMFIMIPIAFIFFFVSTEGYAKYITFPLVNGINFNGSGVRFITCDTMHSYGGFTITWYGLIMLTGAIIAYLVCDHHFYKEYKRHGIIDTMFVLVFLMGVLGSRIWYCYILEPGTPFWDFQNGGLAIMGGALFGAVSGIAFILIFRRYINIRHAMDLVLPCVLIAQAIGRWGNFFNHEVYGYMSFEMSKAWFLPTIIKNQMATSFGGTTMYLPLFLIEFFTNLAGYFVIEYAIGKGLKKHLSMGDRFFTYLIWYGLTRILLEPLREKTFEYNNSIIAAWIMFGCGIGAIITLHIYDYFRWGKKTFMIDDSSLKNNPKNPYIKKIETKDETVKN